MKKIILLILGFISTLCISFASVTEYDNLIDKYTQNPSERAMLKYIMRMESMGNSNAKNPASSATGAFQILKGTWKQAVDEGKKQGLFTSKEANYLLAHPEMRKDPVASTKAAIALNRYNRTSMGGTTAIKQILAYHDGNIKKLKSFDYATLEGRKYVIKANEMYKLQNGGKNMPGFDEYVKNSKTYQKWLKDGTVEKIKKDAKARLSGKNSMPGGEMLDDELNEFNRQPTAVNFKPTKPVNLDALANTLLEYFKQGAKEVFKIGIFILSSLFCLQIIFDCIVGIASNNLKAIITGILLKRGLSFSFYLMILRKIIDGSLIITIKKMATQMVLWFIPNIDKNLVESPLTTVWTLKESITSTLFASIGNAWSFNWFNLVKVIPNILTALLLSIFMLMFIIFIIFAFFRIIFDLLKLILSLDIGLALGSVLVGLGMLDATRQYYSISKIISMCLNYALKFVSITILFYTTMKFLKSSSKILNSGEINGNMIMASPLISYLLMVYIAYKLITSVKIEF